MICGFKVDEALNITQVQTFTIKPEGTFGPLNMSHILGQIFAKLMISPTPDDNFGHCHLDFNASKPFCTIAPPLLQNEKRQFLTKSHFSTSGPMKLVIFKALSILQNRLYSLVMSRSHAMPCNMWHVQSNQQFFKKLDFMKSNKKSCLQRMIYAQSLLHIRGVNAPNMTIF